MRKPIVLLLLLTALEASACGGDPLDVETDKGGQTTPAEAEKGREPRSPATGEGPGSPSAPGAETKPAKRRLIYLDARTLCGEFGVRQIIRRFGVKPGNAEAVARAYSRQNYSLPFREAGYRGCLAGFRK
jgi:hypothetical protein